MHYAEIQTIIILNIFIKLNDLSILKRSKIFIKISTSEFFPNNDLAINDEKIIIICGYGLLWKNEKKCMNKLWPQI